MSFEVSADAYAAFMGRFADPLAVRFVETVGVTVGRTVLDVGCGTGALTQVLVDRMGGERVAAVDPSSAFVSVMRERFPTLEVKHGWAEELPYGTATFDVVLAQLVVHFMTDPVLGIAEMARVARPGGTVAAAVWDHGGGNGPLAVFWRAVRSMDALADDGSSLPGVRRGHLAELFRRAGLPHPNEEALTVEVSHDSFEQWWHPFTLGVGPAGAHVAAMDDVTREELRQRCRALLPSGAFSISATAWTVWAETTVTPATQA